MTAWIRSNICKEPAIRRLLLSLAKMTWLLRVPLEVLVVLVSAAKRANPGNESNTSKIRPSSIPRQIHLQSNTSKMTLVSRSPSGLLSPVVSDPPLSCSQTAFVFFFFSTIWWAHSGSERGVRGEIFSFPHSPRLPRAPIRLGHYGSLCF